MKTKLLIYFFDVCDRTSKLSTCQSKLVGAVLVKENRILAIGYNGVPSGLKHCCDHEFETREEHSVWSNTHELHAEQNLFCFCAKEGINTNGNIIFVSLSPCIQCAKLIYAAGIKEVYYIEKYDRDTTGLEFLKYVGVKCYSKEDVLGNETKM